MHVQNYLDERAFFYNFKDKQFISDHGFIFLTYPLITCPENWTGVERALKREPEVLESSSVAAP